LNTQIDILENKILERYPEVMDILLRDHTTKKNIIWATNNYEYLGENYNKIKQIKSTLITGVNGNVIMPRIKKDSILQQSRVKNMAEVFTPSWVCNAQNNIIDNAWFQQKNVFNKEIIDENRWETIKEKINFPKNKTWKDYVKEKRLEITCGEAPYIISRYDTTCGKFIEVEDRIGLLDRKLRIINENVNTCDKWLKATETAFKNTYAFEWQGDNLLLARESMLFTFIENFKFKFDKAPLLKSIQYIAYIISWNVWQMDGLKGVIPFSCSKIQTKKVNLFGEVETDNSFCSGCINNNMFEHNGIYCLVKDWSNKDKITGKPGRKLRFIDLIEE